MSFHVVAQTPKTSPHLGADSWIEAALAALAANGVESVRVERLAKDLGVTKGSFYWHFKDRPALLDAMLQAWRRRATLAIIERLERGTVLPIDRLKQLMALPRGQAPASRGAPIEAAIRMWARQDQAAAACIAEIDRLRLGYTQTLLVAAGLCSAAEAPARALIVYAYLQGLAALGPSRDDGLLPACEDFLLKP